MIVRFFLKSIKYQLLVLGLFTSSLAIISFLIIAANLIRDDFSVRAKNQANDILENKKNTLIKYLSDIDNDLKIFSSDPSIIKSIVAFQSALQSAGEEGARSIREKYLSLINSSEDQKKEILDSLINLTYARIDNNYNNIYNKILNIKGLRDIYLISLDGRIIYSYNKVGDFLLNINNIDNGLQRVANKITKEQVPFYDDINIYHFYNNEPLMFMGYPIFENGIFRGSLIVSLPINGLDDIILSKSSEYINYLINSKNKIISTIKISAFEENGILANNANVDLIKGDSKKDITSSSYEINGIKTFSFALGAHFKNINWIIKYDIGSDVLYSSLNHLQKTLLFCGFFILLLLGYISYFIAKKMSNPIIGITNALISVVGGKTEIEIPGCNRYDEIGSMALATLEVKKKIQELFILNAQSREQKEIIINKSQIIDQLIKEFSLNSKKSLNQLNQVSIKLNDDFVILTDNLNNVNMISNDAQNFASKTSEHLSYTAEASEQMTSSINAINNSSKGSGVLTLKNVNLANEAKSITKDLVSSMSKMNVIINTVDKIAKQISLLSLNATIEASRAGKFGKGFEVVAYEIKMLAKHTSQATNETRDLIKSTQDISFNIENIINNMSISIAELNSNMNFIQEAVSQQEEVTQKITQNIIKCSDEVKQITDNISNIKENTTNSTKASNRVKTSSYSIHQENRNLNDFIINFLEDLQKL